MFKRQELLVLGTITLALVCLSPGVGTTQGSQESRGEKSQGFPSRDNPIWAAQIDFTKPHDTPWSVSDFEALAQSGMNRVEIDLHWGDIEPQKGQYDFKLLDRYLAAAAKLHLKLYLCFWQKLWGKEKNGGNCPPSWITTRDITSDGVHALIPSWWDAAPRQAYFDYVARTIDHVKADPGFGGVFPSYGWLDSVWGPAPTGSHGVTGYAPADIQAFYRWLPRTYKTLANFNHQWHTSYHTWKDVPVSRPGGRLFPVYQTFRQYGVAQVYNELWSVVYARTKAPLFYYWGGGISGGIGPAVEGNDPDTFFQLAKKYHGIVMIDDANVPGLALLFGSMARAYRVPLIQEWTPKRTELRAEIPQWLGHIGLGSPYEVGEDFFVYPPPARRPAWVECWKAYQDWHAMLIRVIQGESPEQPVAVIVPERKIELSTNVNTYPRLAQELGDFWQHYRVLPHFVTDEEIAHGIVSLQQFRAVVDLGDEVSTLPELKAYAEKHPVLKNLNQALSYLRPYATLDPASDPIEVMPTVHRSSVWLTLANCNEQQGYSGTVTLDPKALGLTSVSTGVSDARTHQRIAARRISGGKIQWQVSLPPAGFQVLRIELTGPSAELRDQTAFPTFRAPRESIQATAR